jgi:hypothetical protein
LAEPIAAVTGGTLRNSAAMTSVIRRPTATRRGDTARRFSLIDQANAISATTPNADCKFCIESPNAPAMIR